MKTTCTTCGRPHPRCNGHRPDGAPCGRWPTRGAPICRSHGACAPQIARLALVRAEVERWGLTESTRDVDPGETLLRLLSQSANRAERYAAELADMVAEHGLHDALVGDRMILSDSGKLTKVDEFIRGLARLEAEERDRAAHFAKIALSAGIAERQVRMAERTGAAIERVLMAAFEHLELTTEQRKAAPAAIRAALTVVDA